MYSLAPIQTRLGLILLNGSLACAYFFAAKLGLALAFVHSNVTTVWPPSGLALAAVLLFGPRLAPGIVLGAFLANLTTPAGAAVSAVIAIGNTAEALAGYWLLRHSGRCRFTPALNDVQGVLALLVAGVIICPLVAATVGTAALVFGGIAPMAEAWRIGFTWWAGDAMGILMLTPLLLTLHARPWQRLDALHLLELFAILVSVAVLGHLVVPGELVSESSRPLAYLVFPPLLWVALRFGVFEAAMSLLILAGFTILQAVRISDVLSAGASLTGGVYLHGFLVMLALLTLPLAARSSEGRRAEAALRDNDARLRMALRAANAGQWDWDVASNTTRWSHENYQLMGLDPARDACSYDNWLRSVHPVDRDSVELQVAKAMNDRADLDIEFRVQDRDGTVRWIHDVGRMVIDEQGHAVGMFGLQIDITRRKQMEDRLAAEKEQAQVTLASIADAVITTDLQDRIENINHAAEQLTGWWSHEVLGKPLSQVLRLSDEETAAAVPSPRCADIVTGAASEQARNLVLVSREGARHAIELSAAPIRDMTGQVLGGVLVFRDVTEKRRLQTQIAWQAGHDVLTGLPNRALLADRLQQAQAHAARHSLLLGVCFVDLDNFKPINDKYGHAVGDELLVQVAQRLQDALRAGDTVARLGGDEFALLITEVQHVENLEQALTRIRSAVSAPYMIRGETLQVTSSIGVTVYPMDDADPDTLLRHADQAMYACKKAGRDQFHLFDAEQDRRADSHRAQQERLRSALTAEELVLHYQPKVNMRTGRIIGMEALIRWQHPERGLLGPLDFLPLAEQSPLIIDIGNWVMDRALRQMAAWAEQGQALPVSINVAARDLQSPDFVNRLRAALQAYPTVPADWLELEILESAALDDLKQVHGVIEACRALGVRFALDDFGTGYSSLAYLKQLPADVLKIDRSFVRDMLNNPDDMTLVEGIASLANAFQRTVIAEGVETAAQGIVLMRLGCDHGQGYGIAKPMPAEAVAKWARNYLPDPQWTLWAGTVWDLQDLPLVVAQTDHQQLCERLQRIVDGNEVLQAMTDCHEPRHCRFEQWYTGVGRLRYGRLSVFNAIELLHREFHALAAQVLRHCETGESARAGQAMQRLHTSKARLAGRLALLERAVVGRDEGGSLELIRREGAS